MTEREDDSLPWCLRGYPFKCSIEEAVDLEDLYNQNLALNKICRNCSKRLEYEKHYTSFAV